MKKVDIKKYILRYLPYVFIFWFFTKVGLSYRLADGGNVIQRGMAALLGLGGAFGNLLPSFYLSDLLVGLCGAGGFLLMTYFKGKNAKKYRKDVEYGSARWGTPEDIKPFVDQKPENNIILTATESLTMNNRPKNPKYARNKNMLVIGGSGSGKTRFVIKPQLMQCMSKDYPVSFCVTDPKGSLVNECGSLLRRFRYKIRVLNTINFSKSHHYNPFHYIRSEKDILKMVTVLIENTQGEAKGGDDFWRKAEFLLYSALIGYIHYCAPMEEQNFSMLCDMISAMEIREDDCDFKNAVDIIFDDLAKEQPQHFTVRQYAKFRLAAGKTARSILVSCGARLACFDIAEVRELTAYDELSLDTLGDEKIALFIITSDTESTFDFISAMALTQMFNALCTKADDVYGGRLPVHVRCLLDEAANVKIPDLQRLIAVLRSRELSICLVVQAQSQLTAIYKDHAQTITGNCDSAIFLGGNEKTTLKDWSEALGRETIDHYNTSVTKGSQESHGQNFQKLGKELMSQDELAVMDGGKCVLRLRGVRPFLSNKFDITAHPNYKYLSDASPKNAFQIEKHLSTRLILKPDEMVEVYDIELPEQEVTAPAAQ